MLDLELETAVKIAGLTGEAVLRHYAQDIISEDKVGADEYIEPVTAADREASSLIVRELASRFPDDAILSEEEADNIEARLKHERVWIIDPIDGTSGFIKKDDDFAIQIGLAISGEAVLGVVYLPARKTLYYAAKGSGTFMIKDGGKPQRIRASSKTRFSEMTIAVSRNHRSSKMSRIINELGLKNEVNRGSVGVKIGLIAEQECDVYIHLSHRTKFWDTCGPQVILQEAGGKLTDIFGDPIRYDVGSVLNLNGILASNGVSHKSFTDALAPVLNSIGRLKLKDDK